MSNLKEQIEMYKTKEWTSEEDSPELREERSNTLMKYENFLAKF